MGVTGYSLSGSRQLHTQPVAQEPESRCPASTGLAQAPYLFVAMAPEESEDLKEAARGLMQRAEAIGEARWLRSSCVSTPRAGNDGTRRRGIEDV